MLRLSIHQINTVVGDVPGNFAKVRDGILAARGLGADIAAFPEMALTGYPAEDLLLAPAFVEANTKALEELAKYADGITAIVGFAYADDDLYNAAAVLSGGRVAAIVKKTSLPNYAVFDENRYFRAGSDLTVFSQGGATFGVTICEDVWHPGNPLRAQAMWGDADLIVNISASPYHAGKAASRAAMLATRAADNGVFLAFANLVGGQDELVFDGNSAVFGPSGEVVARALPFSEDALVVDIELSEAFGHRMRDPRRRAALAREPAQEVARVELPAAAPAAKPPLATRTIEDTESEEEEVYRALVLGTRDYARKNGFKSLLIGLSGGIDSALTASIAVDALGASHVCGVTMPSAYSSEGSVEDSRVLAANMGLEFKTIPIGGVFDAFAAALAPAFAGRGPDVTEENLQARIRGTILMSLSNKFGSLLLTTGNKSENAVGYCTLYGDMAGGFAVIKDVPKTLVYRLSRWRNAQAAGPWIPVATIEKEPSAELRPDQKDTDSLPPYEVLDPILKLLVEEEAPLSAALAQYGEEIVGRVAKLVDRSEYKRRQAPPGVRITPRAFGKDRRYPITNGFKRPMK